MSDSTSSTHKTPWQSLPATGPALTCFGAPRLVQNGNPVRFERRKSLALVIYLALTNQVHSRATLANLFWPEASEGRAFANLRQALWEIRQILGETWLQAEKDEIGLAQPLWVDVHAFRERLTAARHSAASSDTAAQAQELLMEAVALCQEPFLAGFGLKDSPAFDDWVFFEAEELRRDLATALRSLVEALSTSGHPTQAVTYARRLVGLDPLDEASHRTLMILFAETGEHNALLRHYQELTNLLETELGVKPSPETQDLYDLLKQNRTQTAAHSADTPYKQLPQLGRQNLANLYKSAARRVEEGPGSIPNNLPSHLTRFIGRQAEIHALKQTLAPALAKSPGSPTLPTPNGFARLVTLVGPGGTGKTRLSVQTAFELLPIFSEGVWLIELAALTEPDLIPQTVANALDVTEESGQPVMDTLCTELRNRSMLLVLDNCEHLVAGCAQLAETLLLRCPELRILASSREALGVSGERVWPVPPLSFPPIEEHGLITQNSPEHWLDYEAVQLFIDRAGAVKPGYQPSTDELVAIAMICAHLDGMPLAVELAAARLPAMSAGQILQRLDDRFRLLTGGSRTAMPRHRTLRALIDWSYELLGTAEQALLRRLSVFAGGWTLEAAEAVLADWALETWPDDPDPPVSVLDGVARLVNKSLVIAEHSPPIPQADKIKQPEPGEIRYRMLETIREYAHEKLLQENEVELQRRKHLAYYAVWSRTAVAGLYELEVAYWYQNLIAEIDNLRAALAWAIESGQQSEIKLGLEMACELLPFWWTYTPAGEGVKWLSNLLDRYTTPDPDQLRARTLVTLARVNLEHNQAVLQAQKGLSIYQELQDDQGTAQALNALGVILCLHDNVYKGLVNFAESLEIFRSMGDRRGEASSLAYLATFRVDKGDDRARQLLEESLAIFRSEGYLIEAFDILLSLADIATWNGDYAAATGWLEEAAGYFNMLGLPDPETFALLPMGRLNYHMKEYDKARHFFQQTIDRYEARGLNFETNWPKIFLGLTTLRQGDLSLARIQLLSCLDGFQEGSSPNGVIFSLECLAHLAVEEGRHALAVNLFTWADTARHDLGDQRPPVEQTEAERSLEAARSILSEAELAAATKLGRSLDLNKVKINETNWPVLEAELARISDQADKSS